MARLENEASFEKKMKICNLFEFFQQSPMILMILNKNRRNSAANESFPEDFGA